MIRLAAAIAVLVGSACIGPPAAGGEGEGEGGEGEGEGAPQAPDVVFPPSGIDARTLGVVINTADPQSVAVGAAYISARGIPPENVAEVVLPTGAVITPAELVPAKATVDALPAAVQALALTWTNPYGVGCMSIGTALGIAYDEARFCSTPCAATEAEPTFDSDPHTPFTDLGIRPTMMIAAASVDDAAALIARGLASDATLPDGDGWLVGTTDAARAVRSFAFADIVAEWAHPGGLALTFVDNTQGAAGSDVVENTQGVLFYFTGLVDVGGIATNTFRPGAVADHLTSFGGQVPQASGQMSDLRWLEAGATASYGTVIEPCNFIQKFPDPAILLRHYFRGEPIIEAYWKSVQMPGEGLFIGEPLARPFHDDTFVWDAATATLTIETNSLVPARSYAIEAADAPDGPWDHVQDEAILVAQRARIEVLRATRAHYRLVER